MPVGVGMGESGDENREARLEELQRRLVESARRLEETEALAQVGSWEWKLPEMHSAWSKELLRIFCRDPERPPPTIDELIAAVHPDDRPEFEEFVARVRQTRGAFRYSYRIVDAEGEVHYLQARGRTVFDSDGRPARAYGTTQDITELKRSEAQLERGQRLESVGELAGGVAHDFNNLLAVILNNTELLLAGAEDEGTAASLREVEQAATSAAELTRRLLIFSRREATDLQPVDLVAAVREAEALLRRAIGEQVELTVDAPEGLPAVSLEAGQAEQVLVNLAVNARDAMSEGGGRIAISLRQLDGRSPEREAVPNLQPGAPYVVLSVADDGIGMSEETAAQAFDPFFTTKPRGKGTGLGLATVYGIASQAGGQVEIESRPARGTAVNVYLPVAAMAEGPEAEAEAEPFGEGPNEGRTVLVVDNEAAVRTIVCRMLARLGYKTVAAGGGIEAEDVLAGEDVDLLLTDIVMPGLSGRELVERLRLLQPGVRAIYMSGYTAGAGYAEQPWEDGAIVLEKPFTAKQLLTALAQAMAGGGDPARG
jgi:two-component system, cell cycle sensor histidine kinase and response regulator CckA